MNKQKTIEIDIYNLNMTVSEAVEKGKEFMEAIEISLMINKLLLKQTNNKTSKQISYICCDVKRYCDVLLHELHEIRLEEFMKNKRKANEAERIE